MVGRDTLHELDQPLKKLAYVSNHWGPLLHVGGAIVGAIGGMAAYGISNIFSPGGMSGCGFAGAAIGGAITGATFGAYGGAVAGGAITKVCHDIMPNAAKK
ncbi:hypothetical protein VA249_30130 [Vibrio alfacsensis]|nr:hypothetical protein VA249_30130 [Vibrio alfacsensis]